MTDPFREYKKASKSSVIVRMIKFKTHFLIPTCILNDIMARGPSIVVGLDFGTTFSGYAEMVLFHYGKW